jgi:hypothetical protein
MTQLLPLNESEAVFAPFNDPVIFRDMSYTLVPGAARGFRQNNGGWDRVEVLWDGCEPGAVAGWLELPTDFCQEHFDEFVFCLTIPPGAAVRFHAGRADGVWEPLGGVVEGGTSRQEIARKIPWKPVAALRMEAFAREETTQSISLTWFGVRNSALAGLVRKSRVRWDPGWNGLIKPEAEWGELAFRQGLLFDAGDLPALRAKRQLPGWREHFQQLEAAAERAMGRNPEDDLFISDYAPFADERYVRATERGREPLYFDAMRLALVGLVNEDRAMIRHALRFLMCMIHLKHWSPSAETRLPGSTWDMRCFVEEMMSTSAALVMDWLDGALTHRARYLGQRILWDRGLSIIERDMAIHEYMHRINQGPWFCRARTLGGLLLEKDANWPRFGDAYVERAMTQLREGMDRYLLADGGMDEGPLYLLITLETVLVAFHAYARARGLDVRSLLPGALARTPDYLRALASSTPGTHIPDGDCAGIHQNTDTTLMLAALLPGGVYDDLAAGGLIGGRPFTYSQHYAGTGIFSFLLGPDHIPEPRCAAATFSLLPVTGLAGSFRESSGRSLRLVFAGAKANPSHHHSDKGGFVAEVDGETVFPDRGQVRYDDPRMLLLKRTENHNVLAPSFDGATTVEQNRTAVPLIPVATGDETAFRASLDLLPVWQGTMLACRRTIDSPDVDGWTVEDSGELAREGQLVFMLQSLHPFEGDGGSWRCGQIAIQAPWAVRADTSEHLTDCELRKVYRLRLSSQPLREFALVTRFQRL